MSRSFRERVPSLFQSAPSSVVGRRSHILHHQVSSAKEADFRQYSTRNHVSALAFAVRQERIHLRAFVVMPDHWHALFALREPWTLPKFMQALMSYVAAKTNSLLRSHQTAWQDGYYDTRVKTAKQFEFVAYYIEQNPVVKGLVEKAEEWESNSVKRTDIITDPWPWLLDES